MSDGSKIYYYLEGKKEVGSVRRIRKRKKGQERKEMKRDEKKWKEVERNGKKWKEMKRNGKEWKEMKRKGEERSRRNVIPGVHI